MRIKQMDYLGLMLQHPAAIKLIWGYQEMIDYESNIANTDIGAFYKMTMIPQPLLKNLLYAKKENFVLTSKSIEVIESIKLNINFLSDDIIKLKGKSYAINKDKSNSYYIHFGDDDIRIVCVFKGSDKEGNERVNITSVSVKAFYEAEALFAKESSVSGFIKSYSDDIKWLLKVIIFLELTDPEIKIVAANKKHSKAPLGTSNDSNFPVSIVDSTWNKFIVRLEGFGVQGHFRMQRCGEGLKELKLVWINPYEKHGYIRKPKSQDLP